MSAGFHNTSERVLILAPRGRDAPVAAGMLREAGFLSEVSNSLPALLAELAKGAGSVIFTDEALRTADLRGLVDWLSSQPPWSDLPIIILTDRGGGLERNPAAARFSEILGNVSFLERPFHPTTFVSLVRTALRSRRRQYEARELLIEREHTAATLEDQVRERTQQLVDANNKLQNEMTERTKAEAALRHSQKMEAIGQLTGGVAHDFNNLLMAVLGNLDLLRRRIPDDPKLHRLIDGAMQGAQRGAALTQRLLAFARRQELNAEAVDVASLVRNMEELLQRSVGPLIEIEFRISDHMPPAEIDPNQLELALLNLVVNARDAMPEGGQISICLDEARVQPRKGEEIAGGRYLRVQVRDTGLGMDARTLARAVEPFFSTKELGKGTGLGLSMVHGLAVQSGGTLRLSSKVGQGTVAELLLPIATAPLLKMAHKEERQLEARPSTILVVDDDALIAMSTADMLEDLGHQVIEAHSGSKALEILRSVGNVDLLLTDFAMPGMSGMDLARAARALYPDLPILLATGYAELPEGANLDVPRLAKPYQQHQLAAQLAKLLAEHKYEKAI